jgi:ADP-ribosylglycohydrolase
MTRRERFRGIILGTAIGDAVGLPAEGLSPRRAARLLRGPWRHRLILNRGMVSDDTDHTVFVAQSLLAHPESHERFVRRLGWCLRGWLLSLPAGIGFATLRSIVRLWFGISPSRSGVYSAGNGPAMRSAPIGAFHCEAAERIDTYVGASTRVTHSDPRALTGARAVALLVAWCVREEPSSRPESDELRSLLRSAGEDEEWSAALGAISEAYERELSVSEFARGLGLDHGVSGYVYHTVPVAVYAWLRHFGDFRATLVAVLDCGGDTDTVGAIAGALAGAVVGEPGIPDEWLSGLFDWPRGRGFLAKLADRLADPPDSLQPRGPVRYFWPGVLPRNLLFLIVILIHGFRRLAPPY